jgi:hypothetical protein
MFHFQFTDSSTDSIGEHGIQSYVWFFSQLNTFNLYDTLYIHVLENKSKNAEKNVTSMDCWNIIFLPMMHGAMDPVDRTLLIQIHDALYEMYKETPLMRITATCVRWSAAGSRRGWTELVFVVQELTAWSFHSIFPFNSIMVSPKIL